MDPWRGVAGQAAALLLALTLLAATATPLAIAAVTTLAGLVLAAYVSLAGFYYRGRPPRVARSAVSGRRTQGDRLMLVEVVLATVLPAGLVWFLARAGESLIPSVAEIQTVLLTTALVFSVFVVSSLIDWFYVLPRRDGIVSDPPCWGRDREYWIRVSKTWVRHRVIAEMAFIVFPIAGFAVLMIQLDSRFPDGPERNIFRLASVVTLVAGAVLRFSTKHVLAAGSYLRTTPEFCIGDIMRWRTHNRGTWRVRVGSHTFIERFDDRLTLDIPPVHREWPLQPPGEGSGYILNMEIDRLALLRLETSGRPTRDRRPSPGMGELMRRGVVLSSTSELPCRGAGACLQLSGACEREEATSRRARCALGEGDAQQPGGSP